jgi:CheY-like chemotaxis protein
MINNDITLLVAEDDDVQFTLTERILKRSGINNKVVRFKNGEYLENFLRNSFLGNQIQKKNQEYILILDIHMPQKTGIEVLSFMKQVNLLKQIPTIMFSSSSDYQDKQDCMEMGCCDFVAKPAGPDLIKSITTINKAYAISAS